MLLVAVLTIKLWYCSPKNLPDIPSLSCFTFYTQNFVIILPKNHHNPQIPIYLAMTKKQILVSSVYTYNFCYRPLQQDYYNVFVLDLVMSEVNSDAFFVFTDLFWNFVQHYY